MSRIWRVTALLSLSLLCACSAAVDDDAADDDAQDDDDTADDDTQGDDDAAGPDGQTEESRITVDWVEGCNPFAMSDECILPYPSAFFQVEDPDSPTGVRNNYPADTLNLPEGVPQLDIGPTNEADGVSPAGPLLLHLGKDVDPADLTPIGEIERSLDPANPIALFDLDTGKRLLFMSEMDLNRKESYPDRYALIVRPMEPMEMGHRHVAVLTKDLNDADGASFVTPPAFAALRDGVPTNNVEIEAVRQEYDRIFELLANNGYARENLLLVWDFMVASEDFLLGSVLSMREEALDAGALGYTITRVQEDPNQWAARVVEGTFEVPTFLDADNEFEYDEQHHPIRQAANQSFQFTMVIPKKARTLAEPLPLLIFGHGLFGSGRSYVNGWAKNYIQPLAEQIGVVIVATDWIGLSESDLELVINEVVPDLNRITLVTDRLQQSLINNLTLTELCLGPLQEDAQVKVGENALLDPERVYYYGVSLGGIQGSSFVSISDRVSRAVFAVPGAVWLNMLPRSINWVPIKLIMDIRYPDPLTQQMAIALIQTRFDLSDPVNLTRLLYKDPLPDAPEERITLIQESIGDCQVPNLSTEMLARSIGAGLISPGIYPVYRINPLPFPTSDPAMSQYYMVEQVEANPPPEGNVPPTVDNGSHYDMIFLPNVQQQVAHLLLYGEVAQYCDGSCDPY